MSSLKDLGEPEVIHFLQNFIDPSSLLGTNEDAYLYSADPPYILANIDSMARDSDFLPQQSWKQIGSKLVAITFSDLGAKGAEPELFLSSLVLENTMKNDELKELVSSIQHSAHKYETKYLGGDLGSSSESVLTGVGLGSIKEGKILTRHGAQKGDLICVTGFFGLTSIGLNFLLSSGHQNFEKIPDSLLKRAIDVLYEPQPRLLEGRLLSKHNLATSSIDSSDGLAITLHWLSKASNIGIVVEKLPILPELEPYLESYQLTQDITMFGGEEYELIFTIPPSKLDELDTIFSENNCYFIVIGKCTQEKGVFIERDEVITPISMRGWDTFSKKVH
jgi:thiamine-monophosphate kinase